MIYMVESQVAYVLDALRAMDERDAATAEVRKDAEDAYNEDVHEKLEGTVWNTGCASWYVDEHGRNVTLWPDWTFRFRQETARFDRESYDFEPARTEPREPVAA
jgi:cyclohexanone monooxygenase